MKNTFKLFGIIAIVAVIGFSMAGCEIDNGDDGNSGLIDGTWDRGDILITFNNGSGIFTEIKSSSNWYAFQNNGTISIGDRKFGNITYENNLTWKCQELAYTTGTYNTFWENCTITIYNNGQTLRAASSAGTDTYTRQ